jgi:predicted nucleotidyltransferase component of viral defense system
VTAVALTAGWIARHTPRGAGAGGRDAAIIDIAQDLLLRSLHHSGVMNGLVFKGGTALRKLYAGQQGRFSTDLDFSAAHAGDNPEDVLMAFLEAVESSQIGPFTYGVRERRGKWLLTVDHPYGSDGSDLSSKIDVSPPVWLDPVSRGWVPMAVHQVYGDEPLPELQVIRLEENVAEKISRLNRSTPARDMYDLAWIAEHQHEIGRLDIGLVRRLAVLKIWVDAHGVSGAAAVWKPGHEPAAFDPAQWLRERRDAEFDLQDIGALAVPTPSAADLASAVRQQYAFLADLDETEQQLAAARGNDRHLALRALAELPGGRLAQLGLY